MSIITTSDLTKVYSSESGEIFALNKLNLAIPRGATALLGPNGSGKSTLIKIILGLIKQTSGEFRLFEEETSSRKQARNLIGYMPETPSIISKVNAVKYVRHFGILSGLSFTRAMQRAHEVLDYVGLVDRYRDVEDFSTGMKQRLLFAQSLVHDPELLILDEPTTGLSPEGREEMLNLIREINQDYGKSIMFSTHILQDVEAITNYTVLINKGKELFQGTSNEVEKLYPEILIVEPSHEISTANDLINSSGFEAKIIGRDIHILSNNKVSELPSMSEIIDIFSKSNIEVLSVRKRTPNLEDLFINRIEKDIDQ